MIASDSNFFITEAKVILSNYSTSYVKFYFIETLIILTQYITPLTSPKSLTECNFFPLNFPTNTYFNFLQNLTQ